MRRHIRSILAIAVGCCLMQSGQALAETLTFDDNGADQVIKFPWDTVSTISTDNYPSPDGAPDISTIQVIYDSSTGQLQKIILTTTNTFLFPGALFINTDYTGTLDVNDPNNVQALQEWNWYVQQGGTAPAGSYTNGTPPGDGLYQVADNYTYTIVAPGRGRAGSDNGLADTEALTKVPGSDLSSTNQNYLPIIGNWAGQGSGTSANTIIYDFTLLDVSIQLGSQFVIAYTPYCANDVVLVAGSTGNAAVPEPASMVLFGMGLASLVGWRTRRAKK